MTIFPECTTTNGRALLPFKKGAFLSLRPVQPCYATFEHGMVRPTWDVTPIWPLVFLMMTTFEVYKSTLYIMPKFEPNEYMFQKFAEKGKEKWEIYAWCLRDAMAKAANLKVVDDLTIKDKLNY